MASICGIFALALVGHQIARREGFAEIGAVDTGTSGVPQSLRGPQPFFRGSAVNVPRDTYGYQVRSASEASPYGAPVGGVQYGHKEAVATFSHIAPDATRFTYGAPVFDMRGRQNAGTMHNNVAPVPKKNVGPGIGLPASVPAGGGFHPRFRIMPGNVGAYRLTTLPGNVGTPSFHVPRQTLPAGQQSQSRPARGVAQSTPGLGMKVVDGGKVASRGAFTSVRSNTAVRGQAQRRDHGQLKVPVRAARGADTAVPNRGGATNVEYAQAAPGVSNWIPGTQLKQKSMVVKPTQRETLASYRAPAQMSRGNLAVGSTGGTTRQRTGASTQISGGQGGQGLMQRYVNDSLQRPNAYKERVAHNDFDTHKAILKNNPLSLVR